MRRTFRPMSLRMSMNKPLAIQAKLVYLL